MMKTRNEGEYPSLMSFAKGAVAVTIMAGIALLGWSAITFAPSGHAFEVKSGLTILWILITSLIYSIRSMTMALQCKHQRPQTFDRACPEYVTVMAIILILGTLLWPAKNKMTPNQASEVTARKLAEPQR